MNKKRIVSLLLSFALILGLMPVLSQTAYADTTSYQLWVGGKEVTSANADNVLAGDLHNDGKVSFTPAVDDNPETTGVDESAPATLTLNGATITKGYKDSVENEYGIYYADTNPLTIQLTSGTENKIKFNGPSFGILASKSNLNITGSGSLSVSAVYGIYLNNSIVINESTINATGRNSGIITGGLATIGKDASVVASGGETGLAIKGTVKNAIDGTGWTDTAGTTGEETIKAVTGEGTSDVSAFKKVQFPQEIYPLWVGGVHVTSENASNITGSVTPEASYDDNFNILTLKDANITGAYDNVCIYYQGDEDLTIKVIGNRTTVGSSEVTTGIYANSRLTIEGSGVLEATGLRAGIAAKGNIVSKGNVTATAIKEGVAGEDVGAILSEGNISITGGTVNAAARNGSASYGIYAQRKLMITGGVVTAEGGSNALFVGDYGSINIGADTVIKAGETKDKAEVVDQYSKEKWAHVTEAYPLWVGNTRVTIENANNVLNDKKVSFTPASGSVPATLTLDGANISGETDGWTDDGGSRFSTIRTTLKDLSINVMSDSTVTGPSSEEKTYSYGILSDGDLTISGRGALTVSGGNYGYNYGISADNIIIDGKLYANGVKPTVHAGYSNSGLYAHACITINEGAALTATGTGSSGTAICNNNAMLKNAIAGKGWTNEDGSGQGIEIAVNTAPGYSCKDYETCKMVKFPSDSSGGGDSGGSSGGDDTAEEVKNVVDMISTLPNPEKVTVNDEKAIKAARAAFDDLSGKQKKDPSITAALKNKLAECEAALAEAKKSTDEKAAEEVIKQIKTLPKSPSKAEETKARSVIAEFDKLTDAQKALLGDDMNYQMAEYKYFFGKKDAAVRSTSLSSAKAMKGRKVQIKWAENSEATGYQLVYSTNKKFTNKTTNKITVKSNKTVKKTVKKLKAGKKYYFKIRPYTKVNNPVTDKNENVYGSWSKVKKIKAKK